MNTESNVLRESALDSERVAAASAQSTRPFYWSVRREIWENRWIYVGQLAVAGVFLVGFVFNMSRWLDKMRSLSATDPAKYWETVSLPYNVGAGALMAALILMTIFYSSDALYGERRDRSILFWKSLPVSDLTTVLAKASIPLVILPLLTFAFTIALHLIMLLLSSIVLPLSGMSVASWWNELGIFQMWGMLLYHILLAHVLWPFPVYCWLILVSGWARRAPLLWAALPVVAIGGLEKLIFRTSHFAAMVGNRLIGSGAPTDVTSGEMFPTGPMTHLTPIRYFSAPSLWIGLVVAAVFLGLAIRLRRYRDPV
ncbi:MAG TPA: ABC transporter permease [Terriglobales bacterium]|nr:ABC transporter permease [Terriglobales bacterium]